MVTPDDLVIIFYSGHGDQQGDDNKDESDGHDEFFVTYSKPINKDVNSWVRDDEFSALINKINTHHILTFIDACFSAGLSKGEETGERVKHLGHFKSVGEIPPHGAELDPVKGVLLSAALENQKAVELDGWCDGKPYFGGRFTVFFLERLEQARRKQRRVDLLKVFKETKTKVYKHSKRCSETAQEPAKKGKNTIFHRINRFILQ